MKVVVSPSFHISVEQLKSVLTGLVLMALGTLATAILDAVIKWFSGLDLSSVLIAGIPVLLYMAPFITALLNVARKYLLSQPYIKQ